MRRYEERSGTAVDLDAVHYHYILWALSNQLEFHAVLADPVPGTDYMLNLHWCVETNLMALEGIAAVVGAELPEVAEPEPAASGYGPAHLHLVRALEQQNLGTGAERYQSRMSIRLARHLARVDEIGATVVAADLADLAEILGRRPPSWADGERDLENFVLADGGRHDLELVRLFHRRLHRAECWAAQQVRGSPGTARPAAQHVSAETSERRPRPRNEAGVADAGLPGIVQQGAQRVMPRHDRVPGCPRVAKTLAPSARGQRRSARRTGQVVEPRGIILKVPLRRMHDCALFVPTTITETESRPEGRPTHSLLLHSSSRPAQGNGYSMSTAQRRSRFAGPPGMDYEAKVWLSRDAPARWLSTQSCRIAARSSPRLRAHDELPHTGAPAHPP